MSAVVSSPLTLVMTIKSDQDYQELKSLIEGLQKRPPDQNPIRLALNKLGIVHFARFVFLSSTQLAIITTYDGGLDEYVDAFINAIGDVFDQLFKHVQDAPPLPVVANRQQFLDYVKQHDVPCVAPFYSAYPDLRVLDILTLQHQQSGK